MPGPMFQMSVMGRCRQMLSRKERASSSPTPSDACLAEMSSATFARNKLGPMPTVAGMPVSASTAERSVSANSRAVRSYSSR